jgi:hypothetical protein
VARTTGANWSASGAFTLGCAKYAGVHSDFFRGAITDVKVWRGALTDAEAAAVKNANPPVKVEGWYPLEGPQADEATNLDDRSGNSRHLAMSSGVPHWERDRFNSRNGALGLALDDGVCAETATRVIPANDSFSVAAWVSLDELSGNRTVISQSGDLRHRFALDYQASNNRLRVAMVAGDQQFAPITQVFSKAAPVAGTWTHVAAIYDAKVNKLYFYVDGEPQNEGAAVDGPLWPGAGPTRVGCAGLNNGARADYLGGLVDDVRVWSSTVDPDLFGTFAHS